MEKYFTNKPYHLFKRIDHPEMQQVDLTTTSIHAMNPNEYVLLEEIGHGGFGMVYKAKQITTHKFVAIKIWGFKESVNIQRKKQDIERFEREIQLSKEMHHPNIVKLLDKGYTDRGEPFAVFEYIAGKTLKNYILQHGALTGLETGELMRQLLEALSFAHDKGIVHRDLKPQNIMVVQSGSRLRLKVLDFGIGAFTNDIKAHAHKSSLLPPEVSGTPAYCAPEQLRGEPPTVKTDLYAWGLILLECLTGEPVIQGHSVAELFEKHLNASNVPLPPSLAGHPLSDLLRGVLTKDTALRTGHAKKILEAYVKINFNTLPGNLKTQRFLPSSLQEDVTKINYL